MELAFGYKSIDLDDCVIVDNTRNFSGREKKNRMGKTVNGEGRRNFCVELSEEQYLELKERGWDVSVFGAGAEDRDPTYFLRVNLSWYKSKPEVHYISEQVDTLMDEEHVGILDMVNFERLDMKCQQVNKQREDGSWVKKPYVVIMWATVTPDRFRARYANLKPAVQEEPYTEAEDGDEPF